ncbi:MAG: ankyrin repeat domain-containing protein [Anaerolineales bacterium]|nr:ankyrin repeat domain-containing protein [Anaerolineales bacterium]
MSVSDLPVELVQEFVLAAHNDLAKLQTMYAAEPQLLNVASPTTGETALAAAAHVGRRDIAIFLLEQGAPMEITTAAMLGDVELVRSYLATDPDLAQTSGAHNIPLLFHAALSNNLELLEVLYQAGSRSLGSALHLAIGRGQLQLIRWLLDHGATPDVTDMRGRTAQELAAAHDDPEIRALFQEN